MPNADYVIVGAGSAGCVLAGRLSEDPEVQVLVLEAGGKDGSINVKIPAAFANQFHTKSDWDFSTEPEPHVDGRRMYVPRGKMLGGSSSMNAMLYVRGRPLDFDLWAEQGAPGWSWDDVLPYFKRAENNAGGASEFHGVGGPVEVADQRSPRPLGNDILESCVAAGIPRATDYNGPEQDGVAPFQVFQKNGRRWSSADAYLRPAMKRPNVEVVTNALVLGLELDGDRVTGVRYAQKGRESVAHATREVVLSAGAIGSPQILQLSGIGDPDDLRAVGVEVRHELPGVGANLQDHPFLGALYEVSDPDTLYKADAPKNLVEWAFRRTGKLTSTVAEVNAFVRTRPGLPAADIQFHMGAAYYEDHGAETFDGHAVVLGPALVSPQSRGKVWLASKDPTAKPRILTNSLEHPDDLRSLVAGMKLAREIAAQEPLRSKIVREIKPGPSVVEDVDLEDDIRRRLMLIYHPAGTCRMSDTAEHAVVDSDLRVHGLKGLRVADASIMPVITGGNTNAPTMMIAERAADLIRGRVGATAGAAS
jgi:choline dehydrogenase